MNDNKELISRIEAVLNHLRFTVFPAEKIPFSQKELSIQIDMAPGNVSNAKKGDKRYINALIEKINNRFDNIFNEKWYLYGDGEMLNASNITKDNTEESIVQKVESFQTKESLNDEPKISYSEGAPYYNVDFLGGFDIVMNDQTINPEYKIDFKKYNDATCWCNVTGHSMEPEITHGDIIALKKIEDFSFLPLGEVYAIVTTNNMRTIKRLGVGKKNDTYTLIPSNKSPEYAPQQIPINMIRTIFQVLGCMKRL